ncbi:MAG: hypothetical protein QGG14_06465 [Planctomycetota bacterium]|nr:hypothetical protein [Planctomycetota bacterium]
MITCLTSHDLPLTTKKLMVDECFRVLRAGGALLMTDFGRPTTRVGHVFGRIWRGHSHSSEHMNDVMPGRVAKAGFADLDITMQAGII